MYCISANRQVYIEQNDSQSGSRMPGPVLTGVQLLFQVESGLVSFGTKVAPSLNGGDPSIELICWILLAEQRGPNILHDSFDI